MNLSTLPSVARPLHDAFLAQSRGLSLALFRAPWRSWLCAWLSVICLYATLATAPLAGWAQPAVPLGAEPKETMLRQHIFMVADPSRAWDVAQAHATAARGPAIAITTSGAPYRSPHPHWGFTSVTNASPESSWVAYYRLATLEKVDAYARVGEGPWLPLTALHLNKQLFGGYHYPSFAVNLPQGAEVTLAVRVETRAPIRMPVVVVPGYHYYESQRADLVVAGMTLAVPLVVLLYLALLLPSSKRAGIGWFIALIGLETMGAMWVSGHGHVLMPYLDRASWPTVGRLAYVGMIVTGWLHVLVFLKAAPLPKWAVRTGWAMVALLALVGLVEASQLANTRNLFNFGVLVFPTFVVALSVFAWRRGIAFAGLYALAWGAFVVSAVTSALGLLGMSSIITWTIFYAQSSVAALLFGLIAVGHVRTREVALAQAEQDRQGLLQGKDALEEALQLRMRFFSATNHDLRQPLQTMGLYLDLAQQEAAHKKVGGAIPGYLAHAKNAFTSVTHFLESLLDLARIEGKALVPKPAAVALGPLLGKLAKEYQPMAGRAGLELRYVPTHAVAQTDPALVERMVRNLLGNAVRYTREGGVLLGTRRASGGWRIDVVDTGPGLSESDQAKLFRQFARLEEAHTGAAQLPGFGLGLSIVKGLAEALGHRVELASRKGRGSRFSILLPAAVDGGTAAVPEISKPVSLDGKHIWLLEDERDVAEVVVATLTQAGAQVRHFAGVADVDEALAENAHPEAFLADYQVGEALLTDYLVQWRTRLASPVIALTGSTEIRATEALTGRGIVAVLAKPVGASALLAALDTAMRTPRG
jgi:signal transduction histidine kinase/CheY-like chemotaxis protein